MFLPSGRVHAIGAGLVIFEVQQNSDTTFRVFDWNRKGLDGNPRELHLEAALASIDFADFAPQLAPDWADQDDSEIRVLVEDPLFTVSEHRLSGKGRLLPRRSGHMAVVGIISGEVTALHTGLRYRMSPGQFWLFPACLDEVAIEPEVNSQILLVQESG